VKVPDARGRARSIASRKGVCREAWSEPERSGDHARRE